MLLKRREFLLSALALPILSRLTWADQGQFSELDPGCPPHAFDHIMQALRDMRAQETPQTDEEKLAAGRAWLAGAEVEDLQPGEVSRWEEFQGVRLRVLVPAGTLQGAVLAVHGGGWALGSALSDEKRNWALARRTRAVVVSPDYRLAPEHPFPAAPDDCEAAARWLLDNPWDLNKLAITGGSAGSHLAALTLCRLTPEERTAFQSAVLFYGVFDLGRSEVWRNARPEDFPDLSPEDMNQYLEYFLPGRSDQQRRDPRYSPLYGDLSPMPAGLFLVGTADLLAEDSRRMACRWAAAGNRAVLVQYPGAPHGFNGYGVDCGLDPEVLMAEFILENW
ncbi:MAG: alpha/beta hydrolase [Vulcanimicrobiota bacterium]